LQTGTTTDWNLDNPFLPPGDNVHDKPAEFGPISVNVHFLNAFSPNIWCTFPGNPNDWLRRPSLVTMNDATAAAKQRGRDGAAPAADIDGQTSVAETGRPWVLYDGNCPMCSREIAHYRRVGGADGIAWIDVADPATPMPIDGVDREAAMASFHVRSADGQWLTGADGFAELWSHLRGYRHLAGAVRRLRLLPLMNLAYRHFARWRLARRGGAGACAAGQCGAAGPATTANKGNPSP
jgi:predicted DCC family thiol-disulfide oxidoreductase YuxK